MKQIYVDPKTSRYLAVECVDEHYYASESGERYLLTELESTHEVDTDPSSILDGMKFLYTMRENIKLQIFDFFDASNLNQLFDGIFENRINIVDFMLFVNYCKQEFDFQVGDELMESSVPSELQLELYKELHNFVMSQLIILGMSMESNTSLILANVNDLVNILKIYKMQFCFYACLIEEEKEIIEKIFINLISNLHYQYGAESCKRFPKHFTIEQLYELVNSLFVDGDEYDK